MTNYGKIEGGPVHWGLKRLPSSSWMTRYGEVEGGQESEEVGVVLKTNDGASAEVRLSLMAMGNEDDGG
jgi:hypothetical protein